MAGNFQKPVPQRMRSFQNKQADINHLIINYLVKGWWEWSKILIISN